MNGPTPQEAFQYGNGKNQSLYDDMPMHKLAQELTRLEAEAKNGHRTTEQISDILVGKLAIAEIEYHQRHEDKRPETMSIEAWHNTLSDELWDSVIYYSGTEANQPIEPLKFEGQLLSIEPKAIPEADSQEPIHFSIAASHISLPRKQPEGAPPLVNGDTVLRDDQLGLYVVCDGASGEKMTPENAEKAQKASNAAAQAIKIQYQTYTSNPNSIEEATDRAQVAIVAARAAVKEKGDGGFTTAVFGKIEIIQGLPYLVGANAGDSQLLMQEEQEKSIEEVTTNQSTGHLLMHGLFPNAPPGLSDDDEFFVRPLRLGTRFVLGSDGIMGDKKEQFLTEEEKQQAFSATDPHRAASMFIAFSKKNDDKSVVVVDVLEEIQHSMPAPNTVQPVHEKRRKRKWIAAAAGLVALAGVATALIINSNNENHNTMRTKPAVPQPTKTQQVSPSQERQQKAQEQARARRRAEQSMRKRTLGLKQAGTTIWGQSAIYLRKNNYLTTNPTTNNIIIDTVKNDVLQQQGISEEAARNLPVGYTFTIPYSSLKQARQLKIRLTQ